MPTPFRSWLAQTTDRMLASDPGLSRFHQAFGSTLAMAATLAAEYAVATLTHAPAQGRLVAMLLGAVVAMMGSNALTGTGVWRKVRVAVFFPVAIGAGLTAGALVAGHHALMLVGFVVVMFAAVFVRRFGLPFFFYGFMLWMGYFFASFLKLTVAMVPAVLVAVGVASVTVLLLAVTVLRTHPRRVLRSTWRSYVARGRGLVRACADLLEGDGDPVALRRRMNARLAGLAEAGLMVEGWSEEPGALAEGWSGRALRRHAVDVQQTLELVAVATVGLLDADEVDRRAAYDVLEPLARGAAASAHEAAGRLADRGPHARQLATAVWEYVELTGGGTEPPAIDDFDEAFEPATSLMLGNLPGSPAVARDVRARGGRWNPVTRLDMTTRQAVQASLAGALAIGAGTLVSPQRYYWAVIAAFVVFTGTGSRSETFLKGVNRVVGTLLGLVAAILLAHLTAGRTAAVLAVILLAMFVGFYLVRVSYAVMIFCVTVMLGQLYSVLHQLSSGLLVLRLEETAVGAAVGVAVALLVSPLSTRDTVRATRDTLLEALAELLTAVADGPGADLDALTRTLDNRVHQLALVGRPLTRPLVRGKDSLRTRHRLQLYADTAVHARQLVTGVRRARGGCDPVALGAACRALAEAASTLRGRAPGREAPAVAPPLAAAQDALLVVPPGDADAQDLLRPLHHLHRTLAELGQVDPVVARGVGAVA